MADAETTVLLKVKADSSQAVRETDKLTDSQRRLGQAVDDSASKFSKMVDAGRGAFSGLGEGIRTLNQGLEIIDKVIRTVDKAVDAQLVEKANQFGIKVKNAADAHDQLNKALKASPSAFDDATRGLLKTRDAMDDLGKTTQRVVSELVVPVINVVVDRVNDLLEYGADLIDLLTQGDVTRGRLRAQADAEANRQISGQGFRNDISDAGRRSSRLGMARSSGGPGYPSWKWYAGQGYAGDQEYADSLIGSASANNLTVSSNTAAERWNLKHRPAAGPYTINARDAGEHEVNYFNRVGEGDFGGAAWDSSALDTLESRQNTGQWWDRDRSAGGSYMGGGSDLNNPLDKLKAQLGDTTEIAGAAYATLAGGITAAVDAAITGSDSIGRAAAKASAAVLKSLAIEATGRAVFEGALAVGSLAIQDYKGAATHGLAAAKFAAAAAVTGSLAAGLGSVAGGGGGGGGGSAGAPAGGFGAATGGSSGGGTVSVTVNVGFGFDGDSKKIEEAVRRGVRAAQMKGGRSSYATEGSG